MRKFAIFIALSAPVTVKPNLFCAAGAVPGGLAADAARV